MQKDIYFEVIESLRHEIYSLNKRIEIQNRRIEKLEGLTNLDYKKTVVDEIPQQDKSPSFDESFLRATWSNQHSTDKHTCDVSGYQFPTKSNRFERQWVLAIDTSVPMRRLLLFRLVNSTGTQVDIKIYAGIREENILLLSNGELESSTPDFQLKTFIFYLDNVIHNLEWMPFP